MSNSPSKNDLPASAVSREEFDEFLNIFTHEIRNRLNIVGLEASDLAEQLEGEMDIGRLQGRVKDCSEFLKLVRDLVVPEDSIATRIPLADVIAKLRAREIEAG